MLVAYRVNTENKIQPKVTLFLSLSLSLSLFPHSYFDMRNNFNLCSFHNLQTAFFSRYYQNRCGTKKRELER